MNRISVCLIVRDEELLLANCLRSIAPIAAEIVLVDTGSKDRTVQIAKRFGARVLHQEWDSYANARDVYLREARFPWVLVIDGDEAIARGDLAAVQRMTRSRSTIGYRLTVRNYTDEFDLMWRWTPNDGAYRREEKFSRCAGWMKTEALRLFRNLPGVCYDRESRTAHPTPMLSLRRHSGAIRDADGAVIHHFQHRKGGAAFIAGKQRARLSTELAHIRHFPQEPYTYLNAARSLFAEGRDAHAARLLARAVQLDSSFSDAYQLWGMVSLENGHLRAARRHLQRATELSPHSSDAWALLGIVEIEARRTDAALHALSKALELHPRHLIAQNSLGVLLEDVGEFRRARRAYRAALRLHPRFTPSHEGLERVRRALKP